MLGVRNSFREAAEYIIRLKDRNLGLEEFARDAYRAAKELCDAWEGSCNREGTGLHTDCPIGSTCDLCVYGELQRRACDLGFDRLG